LGKAEKETKRKHRKKEQQAAGESVSKTASSRKRNNRQEVHSVHYVPELQFVFSYGHRTLKARLPVRSALVKQCIARLVLWWVTTWESLVL
jgi:hypothetical protein